MHVADRLFPSSWFCLYAIYSLLIADHLWEVQYLIPRWHSFLDSSSHPLTFTWLCLAKLGEIYVWHFQPAYKFSHAGVFSNLTNWWSKDMNFLFRNETKLYPWECWSHLFTKKSLAVAHLNFLFFIHRYFQLFLVVFIAIFNFLRALQR